MHLLALARRAIEAETGVTWKTTPMEAVERHGAACDALWTELRRQVDEQDGAVPVLDPAVAKKMLAYRMRQDIVATVNAAIEDALSDMDLVGTGESN
jgi:hypothetical protein